MSRDTVCCPRGYLEMLETLGAASGDTRKCLERLSYHRLQMLQAHGPWMSGIQDAGIQDAEESTGGPMAMNHSV